MKQMRQKGNDIGLQFLRRQAEIRHEVQMEFLKKRYKRRNSRSRGMLTMKIRKEAEIRLEKEFPRKERYPGRKMGNPRKSVK